MKVWLRDAKQSTLMILHYNLIERLKQPHREQIQGIHTFSFSYPNCKINICKAIIMINDLLLYLLYYIFF
jgi:hypothetical protein